MNLRLHLNQAHNDYRQYVRSTHNYHVANMLQDRMDALTHLSEAVHADKENLDNIAQTNDYFKQQLEQENNKIVELSKAT